MKKKRREILALLGLAGGSLFLPTPDVDWELVEGAIEKPSRLNKDVLKYLNVINHNHWNIFRASSAKDIVLDGVLGQIKTLKQFLQETHTTTQHKRLCMLASDLAQLAGEIFFDLADYSAAQSCYTFAASSAKEAGAYDLWACSLVRHAFLPIFDEEYQEALPLLQLARKVAARGNSALVTRYWVASVEAEAWAGLGKLAPCQKALDQAALVAAIPNGTNGTWLRFDANRIFEQRGACFVRLKQPQLAKPALEEALTLPLLQVPTRRRGLVLTNLALATLYDGKNVEGACGYAHEVLDIAAKGSAGMLGKGIGTLRAQLEPFAKSKAVRTLDQHIHQVGLLK